MEPWYKEGLKFECTGCGKCCKGKPGYVWLSVGEMEKIAHFLKISLSQFTSTYVRSVHGGHSLIETQDEFACIFLKEDKCSIYEARPTQCRTFPFWGKHLATESSWNQLKKECEGIHESASLVTLDEIRRRSGSTN